MIKIIDLHKFFGEKAVLQGVNLEIYDGETITIIGGSGCGKTVFLKHLIGLLRTEKGKIYVDEVDITKLTDEKLHEVQKRFGYLFQGGALFDSMNIGENVAFGLKNYNFPQEEIKKRVEFYLSHVGLPGIENLSPAELSGGMKKRVALARAIAYDPKYILYDEPTTGLDPVTTETISDLILYLQTTLKITSVVVTHDIKTACKVSNRIAMLHEGKIVETGTPGQILNSENPIVRQFITGKIEEVSTSKGESVNA
ncbi:MAG TPA: ABC transporter ATP-binding protein [Elusimicrobia bacterium]|jgi:phospholipid/cholesterol/gamma-HCH transport system ATP-binding protein|nr:ABC transporter ATP-binding protein [Elusimicrobiota bacterium]